MTRLRGLLVCVALAGLSGPARACLNDDESPTDEREFRSQYAGLAEVHSMQEFADRYPVEHKVMIAGGAGLLIGSFALAARRVRTRA